MKQSLLVSTAGWTNMGRIFNGLAAALAATTAVSSAATPPPPMPPVPPENPAILATPERKLTSTGDPRVDAYRDRLLTDHTSAGWRPYLQRLLGGVRADHAILAEHDRLLSVDTPAEYVRHYVTPERIRRGRQLFGQGVGKAKSGEMPAELRLALWGMLSDYGARQPRFDALQALLVLGAYGRAGADQEFQLHHAAAKVLSGEVPRARLKAFATGKLGQTHTPAARFPEWASDGDGDGRIDVWNSRADILATIAGKSWEGYANMPVAVAVKAPDFNPQDPRQARMLRALNASPNVPSGIFQRWDGNAWTSQEGGQGGTYIAPFLKGGPGYFLFRPAWPVNSRDPILPMYKGSDKDMGFALAASLLADAIAGRPLPPLR
jgi:membrane-bound lytic murein transglycosylase B